MMISTTTQTRKKNKIKLWTIVFWLLLWQFASMALDKQILLGIAPFSGAVPAFVGENLFLLGVNLVFAGAHRTWFLLCSGRRRFAFCIGISCEINTRYPCTSGGCIKGYSGRIFYCAGAHLDAIKKPVNTDFFHHGISNHLYKSSRGI